PPLPIDFSHQVDLGPVDPYLATLFQSLGSAIQSSFVSNLLFSDGLRPFWNGLRHKVDAKTGFGAMKQDAQVLAVDASFAANLIFILLEEEELAEQVPMLGGHACQDL